uniref:T9SS type A sorting domain-containing protein n=1 Tax=candidate division WOR-3 bacterium TaxID=2052148 RepID=A0A7C4U901_UNCW3
MTKKVSFPKNIVILITFIILTCNLYGIQWPLMPFNQQHQINATFAECRGDNNRDHYHGGIDIQASLNSKVYAVEAGKVLSIGNTSIQIGSYKYIHVQNFQVELNENVEAGQYICDIGPYGGHEHLHLEGVPKTNILSIIEPFEDDADPNVISISFWRQGTNFRLGDTLYNKVDILSEAYDPRTASNGSGAGGNCGIYRIKAEFIQNRQIIGEIEHIRFDQFPSAPITTIYGEGSCTGRNIYWVTNDPYNMPYNKFWDTKVDNNNTEAIINSQSKYKDGEYIVKVIAYDIDNNCDSLSEDVLLDNFLPYVSKVEIKQEGEIRYEGEWSKIPLSYDLGRLFILEDYNFKRDKGLSFKIYFSEIMDTLKKPSLKVKFSDGRVKEVPEGNWESDTVYTATTNEDFIPDSVNGRATLEISNAYDLGGNENDGNPRTIAYRDANGDWCQKETSPDGNYKFLIEGPPVVSSTFPGNGTSNVDVNTEISITFSSEMDQSTVNSNTVLFSPPLTCGFTIDWENGRTVKLIINDEKKDLEFKTKYTITLTDEIKDTSGVKLDGDKDGKPGGNYSFSFTTREPNIVFNISPSCFHHTVPYDCHNPRPNQQFTDFADGYLRNFEKRYFTVNFSNTGCGTLLISSFPLSPFQTSSFPLLEITTNVSCNSLVTARINSNNGEEIFSSSKRVDVLITNSKTDCDPPDRDHPDDNWQVNDPQYPTPWFVDTESDVGILISGYSVGMGHLLGRFKIPTAIVSPDLRVYGTLNRTIDSLKVLIIPSGGLYGKEEDFIFKERLRNFVQNGGTIISMTQQHWYEWGVLPGFLTGYGWLEDQSCWENAGYFSDWDVVLSGQEEAIINSHIDGFFNDILDNSKVIMKRRTTGMPELFYYGYGEGKVLVCGLYSDWGYGFGQCSYQEANLIRDIVTWALDTKRPISEYYPGNFIPLSIPVHYKVSEDTIPVNIVRIKILNPYRDSIYFSDFQLEEPIYPGDSITINLDYIAPSMLGIYPVVYSLYNDTILLQKEELGERFAVKTNIPVGDYHVGDFYIWGSLQNQHLVLGDTVNLTIYVRNNTEETFNGKIKIDWEWRSYTVHNITVPPESIDSIFCQYVPQYLSSSMIRFTLFPENGSINSSSNILADNLVPRVYLESPSVYIEANTDTSYYNLNDTIFFNIKGRTNFTGEYPLKTEIRNNNNNILYEEIDTVIIDSTKSFELLNSYNISDTIIPGGYYLKSTLFARGKEYSARKYFNILPPKITFETIKDTIITGCDTFVLISKIIPEDFRLKDVKGYFNILTYSDTIWMDSIFIDTLKNLDTIRFVFSIPQEKMRNRCLYNFNYKILYYSDKIINGGYSLFNEVSENISLGKYNGYFVGDTVKYTIKIKNTGDFSNSGYLINTSPECGFYDSIPLTIFPYSDTSFNYSFTIPETLKAGIYYIYSRFCTPLFEDSIRSSFYIPYPNLLSEFDKDAYQIGDSLSILFYNNGGATANKRLTVQIFDWENKRVYNNVKTINVLPKDFYIYSFKIDSLWIDGRYVLHLIEEDLDYNEKKEKEMPFHLKGVLADINIFTSKFVYRMEDTVRAQGVLKNKDYNFNGRLYFEICSYAPKPDSYIVIPNIGGGEGEWFIDTAFGCYYDWENQKVKLLGWDKSYKLNDWFLEFTESKGFSKDKKGILRRMLNSRRLKKGKNFGVINNIKMEEYDNRLFNGITMDGITRIICRETGSNIEIPGVSSIDGLYIKDNYFYILDMNKGKVFKVAMGGALIDSFIADDLISLEGFGDYLYFINGYTNTILKKDLKGNTILEFGSDSLIEPKSIGIDKIGNVYISDFTKSCIYVYNESGGFIRRIGEGRFKNIDIDKKGYIYCVDVDSMKLKKYDENGNFLEYVKILDFEGYNFYPFPDDIEPLDSLMNIANFYNEDIKYISGYELVNLGRNAGFTETNPVMIDGLSTITGFIPYQEINSGDIRWLFSIYNNVDTTPFITIDSISYYSFDNGRKRPIFKAILTKPDYGLSPEIDSFRFDYLYMASNQTIWYDYYSLNAIPNESLFIDIPAGVFSDSGEFILKANGWLNYKPYQDLYSINPYTFFIEPSPLLITMKTDKVIYFPNEDINLYAKVLNNSDSTINDAHLKLLKMGNTLLDTTFNTIEPYSSIDLTLNLKDTVSFTLSGILSTITDTIERLKNVDVIKPDIYLWFSRPDSVDHHPFNVNFEYYNESGREMDLITRTICRDTFLDTFRIDKDGVFRISKSFSITKDETLRIDIIYPYLLEYFDYSFIRFGEKIDVNIDSVITSFNSFSIPFEVYNTGGFETNVNLYLEILDTTGSILDSTKFNGIIEIGDTMKGEWAKTLDYGKYILRWKTIPESTSIILNQGETSLNIIKPDLITIDSVILNPECDSSGNILFDVIVRNNSAVPFYGKIGILGGFINDEKIFEIPELSSDTIILSSDAVLNEGRYEVKTRIFEDGEILCERIDSFYLKPIPVLEKFDTLTLNTGDSGFILIRTKNIGNAIGGSELKILLGEIGEERHNIRLEPGKTKIDTFKIYIPDDIDERTIYGSLWLDEKEYILPLKIMGYKVFVSGEINKDIYYPEDTVQFKIKIENRNERNLKGFISIDYNNENIRKDFYLSGFSESIDFSNPDILKSLSDNGIYVSNVLWLNADSISITPDGIGNFNFFTRTVYNDSLHYSEWKNDSLIIIDTNMIGIQFKSEFFDTSSYIERINMRIYNDETIDTILERFDTLNITNISIFPFENTPILSYGVYNETGRSLWINTIYTFPANDTCNIITDKQVYKMGDTVFAEVKTDFGGILKYYVDFGNKEIEDSLFVDTLNKQFSFVIPDELLSGTYLIDFDFFIDGDSLKKFSSSKVFDVLGYSISVKECRLNKDEFRENDTISVRFKLTSNYNIPIRMNLGFIQDYDFYNGLWDTIQVDSGFNAFDIEIIAPSLKRGRADLLYSFYKDSIFLLSGGERFMFYIPDTIPPFAYIVQRPSNTFDTEREHIVKVYAKDETRINTTLYYNNGDRFFPLESFYNLDDTFFFEIPYQSPGTNIFYYISIVDSFGNKTRIPEDGYESFWVYEYLPPSSCKADTIDRKIYLSWGEPEELQENNCEIYNEINDTILFTLIPQFYPARLKNLKIPIKKILSDTSYLNISFYTSMNNEPDSFIYGRRIELTGEGIETLNVSFDSLFLQDKTFVILDGDVNFFGDGKEPIRTFIKKDEWVNDTIFGELLITSCFQYHFDDLRYRILKEDSGIFGIIVDSLNDMSFIDTVVGGERRYRYIIGGMYDGFNAYSGVISKIYDYTPPLFFGDSIKIVFYDTIYNVGIKIKDGIGIAYSSLTYFDTLTSVCDSIISEWNWFTIHSGEEEIPSYFTASDSAGNFSRYPDTGYYYISPTGLNDTITIAKFSTLITSPEMPITFISRKPTTFNIKIYNIYGGVVRKMDVPVQKYKKMKVDMRTIPNGVYFITLKANDFSEKKKIIILR